MNKKRLFVFTVFVLLLFFLMTFAGGRQTEIIATRLVEFIDGFTSETISTQNIEVGHDAEVPENPYHEDYVFTGWYDYDNRGVEVTNFNKVIKDIKVIALFADDINHNNIPDEDEERYTVRFIDTINNDIISSQTVLSGMNAVAPAPIEHTGYVFGGWNDGYINVTSDRDINSIYNSNNEPVITISENNLNYMTVYDEVPTFEATAVDNEGNPIDVVITHEIDKNNIGTYIVTYTATDEEENTAVVTKEFEVVRRQIEVTIDDKTSVYGEPLKELTYTLTNGTIEENAQIVLTKLVGSNVGNYPITGISNNINYYVTFNDGTYKITKANYNIDVNISDDELTYNGEEQEPVIDGLDNLPEGVTSELTYNGKEDKPEDAGEYDVEIKFTCENDNYNCPNPIEEAIIINKANITLIADNKNSVFGESLKDLTYKVSNGKIFESDNLNIQLSSSVFDKTNPTLDAGKYDIIINASNSNYKIELINGIYTISKKEINIPEKEDPITGMIATGCESNLVYNGGMQTIARAGVGYGIDVTAGKNADDYLITATLDNNHKWNDGTLEDKTFTCTIGKANVTVEADDKETVYGEALEELTYTVTNGTIYNNDFEPTLTSTVTATSEVNDYEIEIAASNDNYIITTNNGTYTITRKGIETDPTSEGNCTAGLIYNGAIQELANNGTGYILTNNSGTDADTYTVTAILASNYKWSDGTIENKTFTCSINPKQISVVWNDPLVFKADGNVHIPTASATGINNENIPLTIANVNGYDGKSIGTQKAIATNSNPNYTLTNDRIDYEISEPIIDIRITSSISRNNVEITGNTVEYNDIVTYKVSITNTGNVDGNVLIKDSEIAKAINDGKLQLITNNGDVTKFLNNGLELNIPNNSSIPVEFTFQFKVVGNIGSTFNSQLAYKVESKELITTTMKEFKIETTINYFEVTYQNKNIILVLDTSYSMCQYTAPEDGTVYGNTNNKLCYGFSCVDGQYQTKGTKYAYFGNCGLSYPNTRAGNSNKMTKMQNAAINFIDSAADGYTNICIVSFPEGTNGSYGAVKQICSTNKEALKTKIRGLENRSGTPYGDAFELVENLFDNNTTELPSQNKDFVVFLSDGEPQPTDSGDTAKEIATRLKNTKATTIFTIGIEVDNSSVLNSIASYTDNFMTSKYYFDADQDNVGDKFREIVDLVNAGDVKQTIQGVADISNSINLNKEVKFIVTRVGEALPIELKYNNMALAEAAGYIRYNEILRKYEIVASNFVAGDKIKFYYYKK